MYIPLTPSEDDYRQHYLQGPIRSNSSTANYSALTLPFYHTCKGKNFRSIFRNKALVPTLCAEFGELLLYFFYGKPTYRVSGEATTSRDVGRFPVSFIANLNPSNNIPRVFPFDTGALIHKVLKDVCGEEINPAKYELGSGIDWVRYFIEYFYGNDKNYYFVTPQIKLEDLKAMSFELQHIFSLATETSDKIWDNRAYTIEVQCKDSFQLDAGKIEAIILPKCYMNDTEIVDYLYNNNIVALTYGIERADPKHMTPLLIEIAENYMKSKGLL